MSTPAPRPPDPSPIPVAALPERTTDMANGGDHSGKPDTAPRDGHREKPPTNLPKPQK